MTRDSMWYRARDMRDYYPIFARPTYHKKGELLGGVTCEQTTPDNQQEEGWPSVPSLPQ